MWQLILSLKFFYHLTSRFTPWLLGLTSLLFFLGLIGGLFIAPSDYQQGEAFRILYVHVPAAFMSLAIYSFMALCAIIVLVWKIKLMEVLLKVSVSIGLWMTCIALVTGSIWGKPMWGTAWIWDARLTSELILFFIYFAILSIFNGIRDSNTASKAASIVVLLGIIDIPIVHYSVIWWNTLHQAPTLLRFSQPAMASTMLYPLLLMIAAFFSYTAWLILYRANTEILWRERNKQWVTML